MNKKQTFKILEWIYEHGVITVVIIFLSLIVFFNLCMTSYLVKWEVSYYVRDNIAKNLVIFVFFVALLAIFKKSMFYIKLINVISDENLFHTIKRVCLLLIFFASLFWAICTQYIPGVDEGEIQIYVNDFIQKEYYMFAPGAYMARYPNNWGMFLFVYIVSVIFGAKNYVIFYTINAFAISIIYKQLSEIGATYGLGKLGQLLILMVGLFYYPILLYSQMLYGHVLGIALALTAIKYEGSFLKNFNLRSAIISAILISIAIFIKNNMEIYLIAMLIAGLMRLLSAKNKKRILLFFVTLFICFEVQTNLPKIILENETGFELDNPCSTWAFVAMGLQESELAPGWWNGYIQTSYLEANGDTVMQSQMAKKSIKQSISQFKADHEYALEFFTKKVASSWANPTLQCYCIVREGSNIEVPRWATNFSSYENQHKANIYLNIVYFLLLMGALIGVVLNFKSSEFSDSLVLLIVFAGGFLFNLIWEAKARYTIMYFLPLIPYSILGYSLLTTKLSCFIEQTSGKKKLKTVKYRFNKNYFYPVLILVISLGAIMICYSNQHYEYLVQDTEKYYNYIEEESTVNNIIDGKYYICAKGNTLSISSENKLVLNSELNDAMAINLSSYQDTYLMYIDNTLQNIASIQDAEDCIPKYQHSVGGKNKRWTIKYIDNMTYAILDNNNNALTWSFGSNNIKLEKYTAAFNQRWNIIEASDAFSFKEYMNNQEQLSVVHRNDELHSITDISTYLRVFNNYIENIVIIAVKDIQGYCLTQSQIDELSDLGFSKIDILLEHNYHSFIGIIANGEVVYESIGNDELLEYSGQVGQNFINVKSATLNNGNTASICMDGIEYSINQRGINIVVYDKIANQVIDSVSFDTHVPEITCYR